MLESLVQMFVILLLFLKQIFLQLQLFEGRDKVVNFPPYQSERTLNATLGCVGTNFERQSALC